MARDNILRGQVLEVLNIHVNCNKVAVQAYVSANTEKASVLKYFQLLDGFVSLLKS